NDNVYDPSHRTPDQFHFLIGILLKMHATQSSLCMAEDNIGLHKTGGETMGLEFCLAPTPGKKSAMIFASFNINDIGAVNLSCRKLHDIRLQSLHKQGYPQSFFLY